MDELNLKENKGQVWQFVVELRSFKPRIWRRFQMHNDIELEKFCRIIMIMFNCQGHHLHQLIVGGYRNGTFYVPPADRFDDDSDYYDYNSVSMAGLKIHDIFKRVKSTAVLNYDFGDDWEFLITLENKEPESILDDGVYVKIIDGQGYGIIDDCGGVWGLTEIYQALNGGDIPDSFDSIEEMKEWLYEMASIDSEEFNEKGFDYFDMNSCNEMINFIIANSKK